MLGLGLGLGLARAGKRYFPAAGFSTVRQTA